MSSESLELQPWINSFCNLIGHEYFAEVSEDFIEDDFNLTGLASQVPSYKEALEMILDVEPEEDEEEEEEEEEDDDDEDIGEDEQFRRARDRRMMIADRTQKVVETSAELLYGLIHQRYICSRPGIGQMHGKYEAGHFGSCPRVNCNGCRVLPVGISDTPGQETVKLYCPSCLDVYTPPNSRFQTVDGAFFGTTFGCLFFLTFPDIQYTQRSSTNRLSPAFAPSSRHGSIVPAPDQPAEIHGVATANFAPGLGTGNIYEPKIFGFRMNERARTGPRMKWLRMKPDDIRELEEARIYGADEDEAETGDDEMAVDDPSAQAQQVSERKKAPIRRRRRTSAEESAVTNGVG